VASGVLQFTSELKQALTVAFKTGVLVLSLVTIPDVW
jgi:hypothetical protein